MLVGILGGKSESREDGKYGRKYRIQVREVGGVRGGEYDFRRASESEEKIQIQVGELGSRPPHPRPYSAVAEKGVSPYENFKYPER